MFVLTVFLIFTFLGSAADVEGHASSRQWGGSTTNLKSGIIQRPSVYSQNLRQQRPSQPTFNPYQQAGQTRPRPPEPRPPDRKSVV